MARPSGTTATHGVYDLWVKVRPLGRGIYKTKGGVQTPSLGSTQKCFSISSALLVAINEHRSDEVNTADGNS